MSLNVTAIPAYTDQLSEVLISKAVLDTNLMEFIDLKSGYSSGSVSLNIVDSTLPVGAFACGTDLGAGETVYTQVNVQIDDLQSRASSCINDLRGIYQSAFLSPSMANDNMPFEEVLSAQYQEKLSKYNEGFLINGEASIAGSVGIKGQITAAAGSGVPAAPVAWTVQNAVEQSLDIYDAIDPSVIDRDDLIMVVSNANYRTLVRALVAQNLYGFQSVEGNQILILPGTNIRVVASSGLLSSNYVFAGPGQFITALTGLEDEMSSFKFTYNSFDDLLYFRAAWRLGVGVAQPELFATNGLA